jgi:hypothetical protein
MKMSFQLKDDLKMGTTIPQTCGVSALSLSPFFWEKITQKPNPPQPKPNQNKTKILSGVFIEQDVQKTLLA